MLDDGCEGGNLIARKSRRMVPPADALQLIGTVRVEAMDPVTQCRTVMPPIRAVASRFILSSATANESSRRLWFAWCELAEKRRRVEALKLALSGTAAGMARILLAPKETPQSLPGYPFESKPEVVGISCAPTNRLRQVFRIGI
ncbi:hypothetical protein BOSEA31B_14973 [Hyphomicrobiales bacterium]|nr:hypothetical protein BOSEA31B_14973 [Hyphomicrobiales bacterium]CAI0345416.1 hypothetical protein BO1005MUT1_390088 [Hyphomicrobiales bacterium]